MTLGIVLTPFGKNPNGFPPYAIDYTYKGARDWYGSIAANEAYFNKPGIYDPRLDPRFTERGEAGYYYDTQLGSWQRPNWLTKLKAKLGLGAIPTDFELSTRYGYLPMQSGWTRTQQGYYTGRWLPPTGNPAWAGYPTPMWPLESKPLGAVTEYGVLTTGTVNKPPRRFGFGEPNVVDVMAEMAAHNDRLFALTLVSTTAVAVSALLGVFRTLKLIKEEK